MNRVALRQSRLELIIVLVLLIGLVAFLVPIGLQKYALFRDLGLDDAGSHGSLEYQFLDTYGWLNGAVDFIRVVPMFVGALLAMPIVMEFEKRTYRLAWTQSITRGRWLLAKLGLALLVTIIFSGLLSVLIGWWLGPQESLSGKPFDNFAKNDIVLIAYAVFALAITLAIGAFIKRTALAVLVAVVLSLIALFWVGGELRPHYMTPLENIMTTRIPPMKSLLTSSSSLTTDNSDSMTLSDDYQPSEWIPAGAWTVDGYYIDSSGNRFNHPDNNGDEWITMERVTYYQPASRYWAFQGIESAIFLGASVVLLVPVVWVVKRRMR